MTSSERTLNTVLSMCLKEVPKASGDKILALETQVVFLTNRLEEIQLIIMARVLANAKGE